MTVDVLEIPQTPELDAITVFWCNYEPGRGSVTITCWGCAWTCYFGAMGGLTIQEFFAGCDVGYLISKLGLTQWLKRSKQHERYLGRLIEAIQSALRIRGEQA